MGKIKINSETSLALLDIRGGWARLMAGVTELDTVPLSNFLGFLGLKYVAVIIVLAMILSVVVEFFATDGAISPWVVMLNAVVIGAMLLVLTFVMYVVYNVYVGKQFQFGSLAVSALIVFFSASLVVLVHVAVTDSSKFHVLQILLAFIASLVASAVFSGFVKVGQRFISG